MHPRFLLLSLPLLLSLITAMAADEPKGGPAAYKKLKFRNIGPAAGGRVCRAAGVPGDPLVYYVATAAGGMWKSVDGGKTFNPIMDDMPTSTIGALAIAPSDPNVVYAGSGEANIRGNVEIGNGIYRSTDAGKTWQHVWKHEGQIGTLIVHPSNPDVAFAAVLGRAFAPDHQDNQRGVFRTSDGGKTWKCVLFKDRNTGASDVCFDPNNPRVLFAGLWQARRQPWELTSGGPGSGLYVSRDGGDTWTHLVPAPPPESPDAGKDAPKGTKHCKGLPEGIWGKIGLAIAPSDSKRVYALIEAEKGGLFRSEDGGDTWTRINKHRAIQQRAWYYSTLTVHPKNPDVIWFPQVPLLVSRDGGKTLQRVRGPHHGDHHDVWIDPKDPERIINSNDGGVDISTDGGKTWFAPPLPIAQFYHISIDNAVPYRIAGTMQDIGSARGPSNSLLKRGIPLSSWHPVGGGEAGHVACDPKDPNVVYAGEYSGYITRYDHGVRQAKSFGAYPYNASGYGAEALEYRFQWTAPILISPHDNRVVYHAANVLFRTSDGGRTWTPLGTGAGGKKGKDLTRNDRSKQQWSGGPITGDNTGVEVYGTIFAVAESPLEKGLLWVGSDDGLVHVSPDGGKTWNNVTDGLKKVGLPEWGTVTCIEASPFDTATAYVVVDAHRLDSRKPYLFVTRDTGKTWQSLTAKMPDLGFLNVVRVDPASQTKGQLLYVGAEQGLLFSRDGGATWEQLKLNLPTVRVSDLAVKDGDLVVGTSGRSIWIFDDLTPLRAAPAEWKDKDVHLFRPRPAYRFHYSDPVGGFRPGGTAPNPPAGVILHYSLKRRPKGDIKLEVLDDRDQVVRTYTSKKLPPLEDDVGAYSGPDRRPPPLPTEPGLHRVSWDLRWRGATTIKGARVDSGRPDLGPLANPGTYTVRLTVEGKEHTATVEVKLDPRQKSEVASELVEQLKLLLHIRGDISRLARVVEALKSVRQQTEARNKLLANDKKAKLLVDKSKEFLKKLDVLEEKLHNPKAEVPYDILARKGGAQLYSQLAWLFELLKEADGYPTQGVTKLYGEQKKLLDDYAGRWNKLVEDDLAALNAVAKKLDAPTVIVPKPDKGESDEPPVETRRANRWAR
jgi:photosystem II stability/assembly factor-like uncharacterized protein